MGKITDATFSGGSHGLNTVQVPTEILKAMVTMLGGSVTIDMHDVLNADKDTRDLEFLQFADPWQIRIRFKEPEHAGDGGDSGGYHGFTGVH